MQAVGRARSVRKYGYMCCRSLACFLAIPLIALGQSNTRLSVEKLVAFVQSSEKIIKEDKTMTDKQLAEFLSRVNLTEKLEPKVVEDLEGLGIGPLTQRALEKLEAESARLTAATIKQVLPDEPIPPPSSLEQAAILDDVRDYVANYDNNLPDFICTEVEHRLVAPRPGGRYGGRAGSDPSYTEQDTITNRLSYFDHKDVKKTILVNSRPAMNDYENLGGSTSNGDFGTMLRDLFSRRAQARFEWSRWATLRGRLTMVFSYRVAQPNSTFSIEVKDLKRSIIAGYSGEVFVDKETHQVTRLLEVAEDIPGRFPRASCPGASGLRLCRHRRAPIPAALSRRADHGRRRSLLAQPARFPALQEVQRRFRDHLRHPGQRRRQRHSRRQSAGNAGHQAAVGLQGPQEQRRRGVQDGSG